MTKTVVETIYGKYSKYEVVKDSGLISTRITLYKDGKVEGSYSSVAEAVEAARRKG
ncbi:hypothetical protein [Amaricoccus sp.]|uniref:hypothetical protein n=1 Tax=Amaricoccus sp. TaxID=1872485 RepID=UPI001B7B1242|nr:hypothetical protein [Amaricoccus sp.]MBP7242144.1 hypothetical protein [Amaricoccus sp.]